MTCSRRSGAGSEVDDPKVRAYVFLDPAATDYVSGVRWPVPDEPGVGAWLEACARAPLRGYPADQLLWWLDQHLWEVELAGDVRETDRSVLGARGRLLAPVDAWTPDVARELTADCARRLRDRAVAALEADGRGNAAAVLAAANELESIAETAVSAASGDGEGSLLAGYTADLVRFASFMPDPARGAAVAARIAAHAHAGGDEGEQGYGETYAEERACQGAWLRTRLGL
jgi:hypothetical protein